MDTYLGDSQCSPFVLPQQLQRASRTVKVLLWYRLQHLLGQLHVSVLEVVVRISGVNQHRPRAGG